MDHAVIIGTVSSRRGERATATARELLTAGGMKVAECHEVRGGKQLVKRVRAAVKAGHPLVVVCGGDGSQTLAAGAMAHSRSILGVIPAGTGNSFAQSLGLDVSIEDAVRAILAGKHQKIDLGVANGKYFANFATVGLAAEIGEHTSHLLKEVVGPLAYGIAAVGPVLTHKPFKCTVRWRKEKLKMRTHQIIIANGRFFGDTPLLPYATLTDGMLAFFASTGLSRPDVITLYADFLRGVQIEREDARYFTARRIRLATSSPQPVSIDGDPLCDTPVEFSVARRALKVIVPERQARTG